MEKNIQTIECKEDIEEKEEKEDKEEVKEDIYMSESKKNIDNFMRKNEFRKAFGLLIDFLGRLNDNEIKYVIDYYSKNMEDLGVFRNTFPSR
jgi:hypothetical protein